MRLNKELKYKEIKDWLRKNGFCCKNCDYFNEKEQKKCECLSHEDPDYDEERNENEECEIEYITEVDEDFYCILFIPEENE